MNIVAYRNLLRDYEAAKAALDEAVASGAQSASVTTGAGGSKSYARYPIAELERYVAKLRRRLYAMRSGRAAGIPRTMGVRFDG